MRTIARLKVCPPTLQVGGSGGKKNAANIAARLANPPQAAEFPDHWNAPDVRGVLYAHQWRVCAYCSRLLPGNDRGDVEHYRPKKKVAGDSVHGGYWWLAYETKNYFLSCRVCNTTRKGNRFPLRPRARRVTYEQRHRLRQEARLLWDPAEDLLDDWLTVDWQDAELIPVKPRDGLTRTQRLQLESSIDFFRINNDRALLQERLTVLDEVTRALEHGQREEAKALAVRYSPQSIVARAVLEAFDVSLIPSPEHELDWLLNRIFSEIDLLLDILEAYPQDIRSQNEIDESLWTLAALVVSPPTGDDGPIRDACRDHGVFDRVKERVDQLLI